jgi:hypothetical protein
MEKLWNHSLCSDLKQLDHSEASSILSEVREVIAANAADTAGTAGTAIPTNNDYGAVSREIIKIDQEEVQVEEGLYYCNISKQVLQTCILTS